MLKLFIMSLHFCGKAKSGETRNSRTISRNTYQKLVGTNVSRVIDGVFKFKDLFCVGVFYIYFISMLSPLISQGLSSPIISSSVGAISASLPSGASFPSNPTITSGTGFVE